VSAEFLTAAAADYLYPAALRAAALLGVADHLENGPHDCAHLGALTQSHPSSLHRMLRLLATRGVFREDEQGRFHLTPLADALRTDSPTSVRAGILAVTAEILWRSAGELEAAVRDGKPALEKIYGMPVFDYFRHNPQAGAEFHGGMGGFSLPESRGFAETYPFPETGVLVDIGGGQGTLVLEVLSRHPGLHGVLFDRPDVLADHQLTRLRADHRWSVAPGDFFVAVPPGGDLYTMQYVLHDWNDEDCVRILRNCRQVMAPGGRVLVIDAVVPPGNNPHLSKTIDVLMLAAVPGRERTESDFSALFAAAGLRLTRVIPKPGALSIVEAQTA
jgi:hypothetical protein